MEDTKLTRQNLLLRQSLPLDIKVGITKLRIEEFVRYYGLENVYVSFSGGKDSTVLLHLARELFPSIKAMFVNTGLEYPEVIEQVKLYDNVDIIRPKMSFKQVIEKYGYPVVSKTQSWYIDEVRNTNSEKLKELRTSTGTHRSYRISKKWMYLLDAPFPISNKCCDVMKKNPAKKYEKETGRYPIIGTLAEESAMRTKQYLQTGCNSFDDKRPKSTPLGFWTEQDILQYIYENDLQIASVYGSVVLEDGVYKCTGLPRTGCMFCLFGIQYDVGYNRIQRLQVTHPNIHRYILDVLGYRQVMGYMGLPYEIPTDELESATPEILASIGKGCNGCCNNCPYRAECEGDS